MVCSFCTPCTYPLSKLGITFLQSPSENLHVTSHHPSLGPFPLFQLYLFLFKVTGAERVVSGVTFPPAYFAASRLCLLLVY